MPDDTLMSEAEALAEKMANGATTGLALTKQLIQEAASQPLDTHLDLERDTQRKAGQTDDYREGVSGVFGQTPCQVYRLMRPYELAEACAKQMWANDPASRDLGMELDRIEPGRATISMTVTRSMTNGHGTCHGGYIFTLADSAFAFACNTYNQITVAHQCSVTYLAPGHLGDRLTATAREISRQGRSGLYDVTITNQNGDPIAEFRGNSRTTKGHDIAEITKGMTLNQDFWEG